MLQVVAAEVEQLELFRQQELFGPEMFDDVIGHVHPHYFQRQLRWNLIQVCGGETKRELLKEKRHGRGCKKAKPDFAFVARCKDAFGFLKSKPRLPFDRFTALRQMRKTQEVGTEPERRVGNSMSLDLICFQDVLSVVCDLFMCSRWSVYNIA